jgi:RNA polymerase sigma-70 factor (ECF subfamily)
MRAPTVDDIVRHPRTNADWLSDLRHAGSAQTQALQELWDYLVSAALAYLERRWGEWAGLEEAERDQLAEDLAQEALLEILNKLDTFRGESRFTTWACKFVINLVAEELRRRHWRNISLEARPTGKDLPPLADVLADEITPDPEKALEREQVWEILRRIIAEDLTARQRVVLIRLTIQDAPVEEVARELETPPNNIYKLLHDARKRLKRRLLDAGITPEYVWGIFGEGT